jgi:hypothetical protein
MNAGPTRRGFLGGLIASVSGATALVRLATSADAATLQANDPVAVVRGQVGPAAEISRETFHNSEVYAATPDGRFVLIGHAQCIAITTKFAKLSEFEITGYMDDAGIDGMRTLANSFGRR